MKRIPILLITILLFAATVFAQQDSQLQRAAHKLDSTTAHVLTEKLSAIREIDAYIRDNEAVGQLAQGVRENLRRDRIRRARLLAEAKKIVGGIRDRSVRGPLSLYVKGFETIDLKRH